MSRVEALNRRYTASSSLAAYGVEIVAAADPPGARLDAAVRRLLISLRDDGPGLGDDMVGAAKALRWRRVTQPQPRSLNPGLRASSAEVAHQVRRLRGAMADEALLDEIAEAASLVTESDSPLGELLLRSIEEVGFVECAVVAASKPAKVALEAWLGGRGVLVVTAGEVELLPPNVDQAYVVGPPRFFSASLVTAPVTSEVSFLVPAWFHDHSIPRSAIAPFAEGAIQISARVITEGDVGEPDSETVDREEEDELLPRPVWGTAPPVEREPSINEVEARKVLLSGDLAMWLDDGDRIRALDPDQPVGARVLYADVSSVRVGTHLLLRRGETERKAIYQAALNLVGVRRREVHATQEVWKHRLGQRLSELGNREVARQLKAAGIKTAERARAWTQPDLIRPNSDHDFKQLIMWLGLPIQPTFGHATLLRKLVYQASADIREELETAVSAADLSVLERDGHIALEVQTAGFRGILATRVLAISPHIEIVARHDARLPFEDRSGQWLE